MNYPIGTRRETRDDFMNFGIIFLHFLYCFCQVIENVIIFFHAPFFKDFYMMQFRSLKGRALAQAMHLCKYFIFHEFLQL